MNVALRYNEKITKIVIFYRHFHAITPEMTIDEFRKKDFDKIALHGEYLESIRTTKSRDGKITVRVIINLSKDAPW